MMGWMGFYCAVFAAVLGELVAAEGIEVISSLGQLQEVLGYEGFVIPDSVERLTNLTSIKITDAGLTSVSDKLWTLPKLKTVNLSGNKIDELDFGGLENVPVDTLNLSNNRITSINLNCDGALTKLQILDLSNNKLTMMLLSFCSNLVNVNLADNEIESILDMTDLSMDSFLVNFDVSNNKLRRLPEVPLSYAKFFRKGSFAEGAFDLKGNQFVCTCDLIAMLTNSDFVNRGIRDSSAVLCTGEGSELTNVSISSVTFTDDAPCFPATFTQTINITSQSAVVKWTQLNEWSEFVEYYEPGYNFEWLPPLNASCQPCSFSKWPTSISKLVYDDVFLGFQIEYAISNRQEKTYVCCWREEFSFPVTGLAPYQDYSIRVRPVGVQFDVPVNPLNIDDGFKSTASFGYFSDTKHFRTAAAIPSEPILNRQENSTMGETFFEMTWRAPQEPRGKIDLYQVAQIAMSPDGKNVTFAKLSPKLALSSTFRNKQPGTTYLYKVRARNEAGWGNWSKETAELETLPYCPLGQYRTGGAGDCLSCGLGTYGALGVNGPFCKTCPDYFPITLTTASPGVASCVAAVGNFRLNASKAKSCSEVSGSNCTVSGLNVDDLGVVEGYWRPSAKSLDFQICKDGFCVGTPAGMSLKEVDTQCAIGHTSALCQGCLSDYAMSSNGCRLCTEENTKSDKVRFAGWVVIVTFVIFLPVIYVFVHARRSSSTADSPSRYSCCRTRQIEKKSSGQDGKKANYKLLFTQILFSTGGAKMRIYIGFCQVLYQLILTVSLLLPSASRSDLVGSGTVNLIVNLDVAAFLSLFEIRCYFNIDYYTYCALYAALPVAVGVLIVAVLSWIKRYNQSGFVAAKQASLWVMLYTLFFVYPGLSSAIIRSLLSVSFKLDTEGDSQLVALLPDPSIDYYSDRSSMWRNFAILLVIVYPVCVPIFFIWITYLYHKKFSTKSKSEDEEVDSKGETGSLVPGKNVLNSERTIASARFLTIYFKEHSFWFESFELLRKLLLTSVYIGVFTASKIAAQPYFVLVLTLCGLVLVKRRPYKSNLDQAFAELSIGVLLIVALLATSLSTGALNVLALSALAVVTLMFLGSAIFVGHRAYRLKMQSKSSSDGNQDHILPESDYSLPVNKGTTEKEETEKSFLPESFNPDRVYSWPTLQSENSRKNVETNDEVHKDQSSSLNVI